MLDDFSEIRLFLLKEGFTPAGSGGSEYIYSRNGIHFKVNLDLPDNQVRVTYPDYAYNRNNPYATKDVCIDYTIDMSKSVGIAIFGLTKFFEDVMERAKR